MPGFRIIIGQGRHNRRVPEVRKTPSYSFGQVNVCASKNQVIDQEIEVV